MSAALSIAAASDPSLLLRRAAEITGVRVGRDGVLVLPASRLQERPAPCTTPTGIAALDTLTGGIPRGALTEICGPASSGRTTVLLSVVARLTQAGEVCALVDAGDSFDPLSAAAAGVDLQRVLWVRCSEAVVSGRPHQNPAIGSSRHREIEKTSRDNDAQMSGSPQVRLPRFPVDSYTRKRHQMSRVEQALKATDLILQGGGFGLVVVDLADITLEAARRIPLTSWFRFRRAVENTATSLLVLEQQPYAKTCAAMVVQLSAVSSHLAVHRPTRQPSHAALLGGLQIRAEVARDRQQRKPAQPVAAWESKVQFAI